MNKRPGMLTIALLTLGLLHYSLRVWAGCQDSKVAELTYPSDKCNQTPSATRR